MNEIITATIAKHLFQIEKDAYQKLEDYLESIREKFADHHDREEIVFDIESGIAEHFKAKNSVITSADIDQVISEMGEPEAISEEQTDFEGKEEKTATGYKKLFRDPDNQIIAGIASGLANYFNVDPVIFRLLFIASLFAGGTGIIVYVLLWLLIPEAKTRAEKLQMQGEAVTLESVKDMAEQGIKNIRQSSGAVKKIGHLINVIITGVGRLFAKILVPLIRIGVGTIMMFVSVVVLLALLGSLFTLLFNFDSSYIDAPFLQSLTYPIAYVTLTLGFFIAAVPMVFLSFLSLIFITKKNKMRASVALGLLGLWVAAVIAGLALTPKIIADYKEFASNDPDYQEISQVLELPRFSGVSAANSIKLSIAQARTQEVTITGQNKNLDNYVFEVRGNTLEITRANKTKICFFCSLSSVEITIETPTLDSIAVRNSSSASATGFEFSDLKLSAENSSSITLSEITADSVESLSRNSSRITAGGETDTLNASATNSSSFRGYDLLAQEAVAQATNSSRVQVNVEQTLDAVAERSSIVQYLGEPEITQSTTRSSRIEQSRTRF